MSRTSTALKRLGVAAVAAITVGAGLPLLAGSANAAVDTITIQGGDQSAGLGSCLAYTVSVTNQNATDATPTVTIRLSEDPGDADATSEVTFCNTTGGTTVANPDNAEDVQARFTTTRTGTTGAFTVTFGARRTTEGSGVITAFNDLNNNGRVDAGERVAAQTPRFTGTEVNTNPDAGRSVVLTPDTSTVTTGQQSDTFTATVRDNQGVPVQGATVTVTVSNGSIVGATPATATSTVLTTNSQGQVTFRTQTPSTGSGTQTVTVRIPNGTTDTSTVVYQAATTPPTTVPPTQGPDCTRTPTIVLERTTIIATGRTGYTVTNAPPNSTVQIFAYSRPQGPQNYRVVRTVQIGANGSGPGGDGFTPPTNTRLYAQVVGCDTDETRNSIVINVRTQISLNVRRNGPKNYTFSGRLLPARPGGLIASLYRVTNDGRQILTAQARANSTTGTYVINRRFTGTGRFGFVVRTGQDLQNAPGSSNVRSLLVF